jgi:hypothetical protein
MREMKRIDPAAVLILLVSVALAVAMMLVLPASAQSGAQAGSISAFGESLVLEEPVAGNVQLLGGNVLIDTRVEGDVISFGADVTIGGEGSVRGDVFILGGSLGGSVENVAGSIFAPRTFSAAMEGLSSGGRPLLTATEEPFSLVTIALKLSLLLVWLAVAVVVVLFDGKGVRLTSLEARAVPFHSMLLGIVAFTSFVLSAVVFSYLVPYVIGIFLLALLALFAVVTKVYGMIAIFHALGSFIARPSSREELQQRGWLKGDMAMVVIGLLVLGAVRMIPVAGNLIWMILSIIGVGVALATRFGRRDPAFLSWRPIILGQK